jgi:ATPase subunit of ABC transporter with duplicated ATPase domains
MEAMEDTILSFTGAAIIVTHDRYLLGRVADSLLRIHEDKAEFREGGYEEHQAWVDLDIGQEAEAESAEDEKPKAKEPVKPKAQPNPRPAPIDKEKQKNVRRWERKVGEAEAKVAEQETRIAELVRELASMDPMDWKAFNEKLEAQKALETELAYIMAEWEEAQTALEEAQR